MLGDAGDGKRETVDLLLSSGNGRPGHKMALSPGPNQGANNRGH